METRSIIRNRPFLCTSLLVLIISLGSGGELLIAQSKKSQEQPDNPAVVPPEDAEHYDPDDVKNFDDVVSEDRTVKLRGQDLILHLYRPKKKGPAIPAIYACGDGGWRGLAPRTAIQLAHQGAAVVGLDSKVYLREFSSAQQPLTVKQLSDDYAELATVSRDLARVDQGTRVYVYGWSLGAGFAVAVGSEQANRENWAGIVSIGLPSQNQLVSGQGGNRVDLNNPANSRYGFKSAAVMGQISPLPLVMIQSTSDTASPPKVGRMLFASAQDPKQIIVIKASNHRFSGAREEFYASLAGAISWISQTRSNDTGKAQPEEQTTLRNDEK
jgi:dienelactone hydrolase